MLFIIIPFDATVRLLFTEAFITIKISNKVLVRCQSYILHHIFCVLRNTSARINNNICDSISKKKAELHKISSASSLQMDPLMS